MNMAPQAVYVLNRREYKESSLLLDIFSLEYGRLNIIANGALKSKKSWSAMLQAFQPLLVVWSGRSALKTLTSIEAPSSAITLAGTRLFSAYYLNELLLKLLPQGQGISNGFNSSDCFLMYSKTLEDLVNYENIELPLRRFEFYLLSELGVFPDFSKDNHGQMIESDLMYYLIPQEGFQCTNMTSGRFLIKGHYLKELSHILDHDFEFTDLFLKQIKSLMRSLISELLNGQELKSRALFKTYKPFRSIR